MLPAVLHNCSPVCQGVSSSYILQTLHLITYFMIGLIKALSKYLWQLKSAECTGDFPLNCWHLVLIKLLKRIRVDKILMPAPLRLAVSLLAGFTVGSSFIILIFIQRKVAFWQLYLAVFLCSNKMGGEQQRILHRCATMCCQKPIHWQITVGQDV